MQDLRFVDSLQRKFAGCVGFIPRPGIEFYLDSGAIRLAEENDDAAGYILSRPALRWNPAIRPIFQACVAMDAQRRHHGLAMLRQIEAEAKADGKIALQANCAVGLDANEFWQQAGFKPICHMTPDNVRGREIICWRKPLQRNLPFWFLMPPARAGFRARRARSTRNVDRTDAQMDAARRFITAAQAKKQLTQEGAGAQG